MQYGHIPADTRVMTHVVKRSAPLHECAAGNSTGAASAFSDSIFRQ